MGEMLDGKKRIGRWLIILGTAMFIAICISVVLATFPTIEFNGFEIQMFAPERLLERMPPTLEETTRPWASFEGRACGEYVLQTPDGEVTLKDRARASDARAVQFPVH